MALSIQQNIPLQAYNSLRLPASAEYFCTVTSEEELCAALDYARQQGLEVTPLGGGSNLVLAGDLKGLVIKLDIRGISSRPQANSVEVCFAAGENWHRAVMDCLDRGWYGLENLSLIPGTVGAAPIQNIGAYGVELADLFVCLRAVEISTGELCTFDAAACQFGYRDSVFKGAFKDQFIILDVTLRLHTQPSINIAYPALQQAAAESGLLVNGSPLDKLTPQLVSELVCRIRSSKLPDPAEIPNAGSFFKNPLVSSTHAQSLLRRYPQMPTFAQPGGQVKIPAAWLIDQCGFKGVSRGPVAVHKHQALVLTHNLNNGGGDGSQLLALAAELQDAVEQRFSIRLETEPRIYGST